VSGVEKFEKYLKYSEGIEISDSEVKTRRAVVKISGSGRFLERELLKVSGSAKVEGFLEVELVSVSGSLKVDGSIKAETVKIAGAANITEDLEAEVLRVAGLINVKRRIKVKDAEISGSALFDEGMFETFRVNGLFRAFSVQASKIELEVVGESEVNSIKTDFIEVRGKSKRRFSIGWLHVELGPVKVVIGKRHKGILKARKIEALKATLENVECDELKARVVVIRKNCKIRKVYYSESLRTSEKAEVGEIVKIDDTD